MTKLKNLKGTKIQFIDADPVEYVGVWSSGGAMNTAGAELAGAGVQTAALSISGKVYPPGGSVVNVESYDGTSYSEITEVNVGRIDACAFGTSTATFFATGNTQPPFVASVARWNGSSWTETTDTNTDRNAAGSYTQLTLPTIHPL